MSGLSAAGVAHLLCWLQCKSYADQDENYTFFHPLLISFLKFSLFSFHQISSFVLLCLLFSQCWSGGVGSLGHSRSGGLWQTETSLLSRHWRHPHVFLHRQPWQLGCVQSKRILAVAYIHDINKTNSLFCVCHISDFIRRYFWTVLIVHLQRNYLHLCARRVTTRLLCSVIHSCC